MNSPATRCKCPHCYTLFVPDYRNRGRQELCSSPDCQAASKRRSQDRWLAKAENQDYFRGPEDVKRVQAWRAEHPHYWKRLPRKSRPPAAPQPGTLQMACSEQAIVVEELEPKQSPQVSRPALQELCEVKTPLLVGLIAQFTDAALQEDILAYTRRWIARGQDILDQPARKFLKGNLVYDAKENPASGPAAAGAGAVQLD